MQAISVKLVWLSMERLYLFKDGVFSYYVASGLLKESDTIQLQGYDAEGSPISDLTLVSIQK